MGKKDDYQFDYLDDNCIFADQINGALFNGKQVVKAEELEKFAPIITLVVYFGTEHPWNGAKCLHDLLDIDDELKEYVTNYRLNLYDCQAHDTFDEYQTGLRQVFESVRYSKDKEKLKDIMEQNREEYSKIDSETKDMLKVVANIEIPDKFKTVEDGEERYDMCKAFEDMRQEGYDAGIERGIRILIQTVRNLGASKLVACEQLIQQYSLKENEANEKIEMYWGD